MRPAVRPPSTFQIAVSGARATWPTQPPSSSPGHQGTSRPFGIRQCVPSYRDRRRDRRTHDRLHARKPEQLEPEIVDAPRPLELKRTRLNDRRRYHALIARVKPPLWGTSSLSALRIPPDHSSSSSVGVLDRHAGVFGLGTDPADSYFRRLLEVVLLSRCHLRLDRGRRRGREELMA